MGARCPGWPAAPPPRSRRRAPTVAARCAGPAGGLARATPPRQRTDTHTHTPRLDPMCREPRRRGAPRAVRATSHGFEPPATGCSSHQPRVRATSHGSEPPATGPSHQPRVRAGAWVP
eukprot:5459302-Prymnesium_polylepis.1